MSDQPCTEGLDQCQYTVRQTIDVLDKDGNVVDESLHHMKQPVTYAQAMAIKYLALLRAAKSGVENFLAIIDAGDGVKAMRNAAKED